MTATTIHPEDIMMARISYCGREISSFSRSGFETLADVLRAVRAAAGSVVGYLTITLRNATCGWTENRALYIPCAKNSAQAAGFPFRIS